MARFCDSNQKRGVTLVELIVVLVILAVLAALLVPSLTGYIDKAVEKRIMLQARSLLTAAQATIDEAYAKGELHIVYRITPGRPARRNPAGWSRVQKATGLPTWSHRDGLLFLKSSDYNPDIYHPQSG